MIRIRPATIDDADAIHAAILGIAQAVDELHKVKSTPDDIRRFGFGPNPAFEALIAEVDGAFAGLCLFFPSFSTWHGRPGVYVQDLFVAEEFRGHGVGEKLLKGLAAVTRARGGRYIRLSVDTGNRRARAFYERIGLRLSDAEQIYTAYREDFDALADAGDHEG
ncbi:GNAT family N-acetyltransferase [Mesorhizobium sp. WSM2239]|uniref:GNAT family N-acetyltransferase n=2 Tax=unclassified Mesorhizobium TaxID=325217 RepID=A0AAU8D955_9HYPH